jgi:hypothetical protein
MAGAWLSRNLAVIDQLRPQEDSMTSQLTPSVAQEHISDMQRAAERERSIRGARARMTGTRMPRVRALFALPFRPAQV